MAYQAAKTNWTPVDGVTDADLNRIEGNIDLLHTLEIVNDAGGVKLAAANSTDDILATIVAAGEGIYTLYAAGNSLNTPNGKSIRGIAHITGSNPSFGWVWVTDYSNNVFTNYINNGAWTGWEGLVSDGPVTWSTLPLAGGATAYAAGTACDRCFRSP